jgi:hypothetical protein
MKFSQVEDERLAEIVRQQGAQNWDRIACEVKGRNARQCRDRWLSYLAPDVVNGPWTQDEEQLLVRKYRQFGASWKRIATCFKGRTDINVKSRWLLIQRRTRREWNSRFASTALTNIAPVRPAPLPPPTDDNSHPQAPDDPWDLSFIIDDRPIPDDAWLHDF